MDVVYPVGPISGSWDQIRPLGAFRGPPGPKISQIGQKYRKLEFSKCAKKKFDPYISPIIITDPQMHENPPKKAEKHVRMAENGENAIKNQKNAKTQKRPNRCRRNSQDVLVWVPGA